MLENAKAARAVDRLKKEARRKKLSERKETLQMVDRKQREKERGEGVQGTISNIEEEGDEGLD
jgi:hypothetical protein